VQTTSIEKDRTATLSSQVCWPRSLNGYVILRSVPPVFSSNHCERAVQTLPHVLLINSVWYTATAATGSTSYPQRSSTGGRKQVNARRCPAGTQLMRSVKKKNILIFLLVSISLQTCIHFKAEQKAPRQKEEDSTEKDAVNTPPTKARAARAPTQEEKKERSIVRESLFILAVRLARSLYRRARDLSISQRASRCAPWLCMLEPWTAPRPCLTSCDALRSTSCGR
jgi:hypothetical protein